MSLSDDKVISLLGRYYVPVFTSNEDYNSPTGAAPADERAELARIHREGHAAKLSVGSVHGFLMAPDGRLLDSLHVAEMKPGAVAAMLEKHARALGTTAGPPPLRPAPPPVPSAGPGVLRLHVTARYLERRGSELVLVEGAGGNWSALPGEDWLLLSQAEQGKWLPPASGDVRNGYSWQVADEAAWPLLTRFYPPTENNDLKKNRREEMTLTATVESIRRGSALARLEGTLRMKHPFYHKDDNKAVTAKVVGYLTFDPERRRIASLQMVTESAEYGGPGETGTPFGVAVRTA